MILKSIRSQMLISLLVGILILSGLLGYFVDKQLKRLPDQSMLQYQEITNARADELDKILEKFVEEVKMISQSSVVKSMDMDNIQKFLPSVVIEGNHRNMTIAGLDGKGWTTQGNEIDISGQEQYLKIFDEGEVYWISQPFVSPFADPDIPIITISHEVRNNDIVVGLVNIVIDINFLTNVVNSINVGETSYAWIVDRNVQIIVHPDGIIGIDQHISDHIPDVEVAQELLMQNNLRWLKYKDEQGGEVFTFYKDIKGTPGWTLLLSISTDEVLGSINDVRLKIFLAFIMIIIAVSIFAYFYSNSISKPILKLKKVFEEAESGNTEVVADETVRNEIGTAAKSFNKMLRKIKTLTYYDPLTHLYNLNGFLLELPYQIKKISKNYPIFALVVVSIDNFKRINSISGYLEGNLVLQIFSERLQIFVDEKEIIGRYFGDEFIILLKEETAERLQYRIQQLWLETSTEMIIKENEYRLKVSMGVATSDSFQIDIEKMINEANIAKLQAKKVGGNRFQFYDTKMDKIINFEQKVENALYHAIENSELYLVYQPIVDINTNKIIGTEALLRWNNQLFSDVSTPKLIEIAEQSGLIIDIGKWVLTEALRQNKFWQNAGFKPMFVSVNISVLQFDQANFIDTVGQAIKEIGIAPKYIELEITESTAMTMVTEKLEKMQRLKEMGLNIAIDDFGTGYSSLAYFTKFPISTLKIDRSFVKDISNDESARTVITTIISFANSIGISTTAEGVEYEDQKQFLKEMGCVKLQGYLISKPVEVEKLEQLLEKI